MAWSLIPEAQRLIRMNIREMHSLCLPILFLVFHLHKNLQHRNVKNYAYVYILSVLGDFFLDSY